jgi:hypothetical protein
MPANEFGRETSKYTIWARIRGIVVDVAPATCPLRRSPAVVFLAPDPAL